MGKQNKPKWIEHQQLDLQSYIKPIILKEEYQKTLDSIYNFCKPNECHIHGYYSIASENQTAYIILADNSSAIFYDIGQAAILKSAYSYLYSETPETKIFKLFQSCACLEISKNDHFLCDKLGDLWTVEYNGPSVIEPSKLSKAQGTLTKYLHKAHQPLFNLILDSSIMNHEFYHLRVSQNLLIPEIEETVEELYEQIAIQSTSNGGPFVYGSDVDLNSLEKNAKERKLIREHYLDETNRKNYSEEIACDFYALQQTAIVAANCYPDFLENPAFFSTFIGLYYIKFNLHLLHLGFTERAKFYVENKRGDLLDERMFIYNLRRNSISVIASILDWSEIFKGVGNYAQSEETMKIFSENLQHFFNNLYLEMCDKIIIPTTIRLNSCFDIIQEKFPKEQRPIPETILNPNERIYLSGFGFNLNHEIVNEMLEQFGVPEAGFDFELK